ncbi:hypothetical protein ACJMK2_003975 [Sinanodonta woodiana]|uniref:Uncharacterized protein n=1 Tax=Sinanodonta woodiana TaxID=1069815 RepID=A0ABD3XZS9_SINWO
MDHPSLDINVLPHQPRLKIEAARKYLDSMPCVISGNQHMAVWSDIREIMFPLCTDPNCFIVLSALKCVLTYPRSETAMHPCSQVEHIEFLRQFRIILPGTILVDIGYLTDLAVLMKLFDIVRIEHLSALRKSTCDCHYLNTSSCNSILNATDNETRCEKDTHTSRVKLSMLKLWRCQPNNNGKTVSSFEDLPSVYRRYDKKTKYNGEETGLSNVTDCCIPGIASNVDNNCDLCMPGSNTKGKADYPQIDRQDSMAAENFIPMTILLENFHDARDFLVDVARKYLTSGCKRMYHTVTQCSREEAKAFTSHLFSTKIYNVGLKYFTSRSLLLSWQKFSSGFLALNCTNHEDIHNMTTIKRHKKYNILKEKGMTVFSPLEEKEHQKIYRSNNIETCQPYHFDSCLSERNKFIRSEYHIGFFSYYADGINPIDGASLEAMQSSSCETMKIHVDEEEAKKSTDQKEITNHRNWAQKSPENKGQDISDMKNNIETQDASAKMVHIYTEPLGWNEKAQNNFKTLPDNNILVLESVQGNDGDRCAIICKADTKSMREDMHIRNQSPLKDVVVATQNSNNSAIFRYSHSGSSSSSDSEKLEELLKTSKLFHLDLTQAGSQDCTLSESSVESWNKASIDNKAGTDQYPLDYGAEFTECIPVASDLTKRQLDIDAETHHAMTSFCHILTLNENDSRTQSITASEVDQDMALTKTENHENSNVSNGKANWQAQPLCNSNVNQNKNDASTGKLAAGAKVPAPLKRQSSLIHDKTTKSISEKVKELSHKLILPKMPSKSSVSDTGPFNIDRKSKTSKGSLALSKSNLKWNMSLITGIDKPTPSIKEVSRVQKIHQGSPRLASMHTAEAVDLSTFVENGVDILNEDIRAAELLLSVSGRFSATGSLCPSFDHRCVSKYQEPTPRQDLSGTLSKPNQCDIPLQFSSNQLKSTSQSWNRTECGVKSDTKPKSKRVYKEINSQYSEVSQQLYSKAPSTVTNNNVNLCPYGSGHAINLPGITGHSSMTMSCTPLMNSQVSKDKSVITTRTPNNTPISEESVLEKSGNNPRLSFCSNHDNMKVGDNTSQASCNANTYVRAPMPAPRIQLQEVPAHPLIQNENSENQRSLKKLKNNPNAVQNNMSELNSPAASDNDTEILNFGTSSSSMPDVYDSFARKRKPKCVLVEPTPITGSFSKGNNCDIKDVQNTNHQPVSQTRLIHQKKIENSSPLAHFDASSRMNTHLTSVAVQTDPENYETHTFNVVKELFSQDLPLPTLPQHCTSDPKHRKVRQESNSYLDTSSIIHVKSRARVCPACSVDTTSELVSTVNKRTTRKKIRTSKRRSDTFQLPACNAGMVSKPEPGKLGPNNGQKMESIRHKLWSFMDSDTKFFPIINDLSMSKNPRRVKKHIERDLLWEKLAMLKHAPKEGTVGKNKNMSAQEVPTLENVFSLLKNVVLTQSEIDLSRCTDEDMSGNVIRRYRSDSQLEMQLPLSDLLTEFLQIRDDLETASTHIDSKLDEHLTACEPSDHQNLDVLSQKHLLTNQHEPVLIIEDSSPEDNRLIATWQDGRKKQGRSSVKCATYLTPHTDGNAKRERRRECFKMGQGGNEASDQEILEIMAAVSDRTPVRNNYLPKESPDKTLQEPSGKYKVGHGRRVKSAYSSTSKQSKTKRTDRLKSAHCQMPCVRLDVIGVPVKPEADHKRIGSDRITDSRSQSNSESFIVAERTRSSAKGLEQRTKSASFRVARSTRSSSQGIERRVKSASSKVAQSASSSVQGLELLAKSAVMRESLKYKDPEQLGCNFFKGILNDELWRPHTSLIAHEKKKDTLTTSSPFRNPRHRGKINIPGGENRLVNNFMHEENSNKYSCSTYYREIEAQEILKCDSATQTENDFTISPTYGERILDDLQQTENVSNNFIPYVQLHATEERSDQDSILAVSSSREESFSAINNCLHHKERIMNYNKHNREAEEKEHIWTADASDKSTVQQCCNSQTAYTKGWDQSPQDNTDVWSIPELTPETAYRVISQAGSESSLIMPKLIPQQDIEIMRQVDDEYVQHEDWNSSLPVCETLSVENTAPGQSVINENSKDVKELSSSFSLPEDVPSYRLNVYPSFIMLNGLKRTEALEQAMLYGEVLMISDPEQVGFGHYCIPRSDGTFLLLPCIVPDQVLRPHPRNEIEVESIASANEINMKDGQVEQGPYLKRSVMVEAKSITGDLSQCKDDGNCVEGGRMPISLNTNFISNEELCQYKEYDVSGSDIEEDNVIKTMPDGKYESQFDLEQDMIKDVSQQNADYNSNHFNGKSVRTIHRMKDQGDDSVQKKFIDIEHDSVKEIRYMHTNLQELTSTAEVIFNNGEVICTTRMETDKEMSSYAEAGVCNSEDGINSENMSFAESSRTGYEMYAVSGIDVATHSFIRTKDMAGVKPVFPSNTGKVTGFASSEEYQTNGTKNGTSNDHTYDNLDYSKNFLGPEDRNQMKPQSSHVCSKNVVSDIELKEICVNNERSSTTEILDEDGTKLCTHCGNDVCKTLSFDEDINFETGVDDLVVYFSSSESHISNSSPETDTQEKHSLVSKQSSGCSKEIRENSVSHFNVQFSIEKTKLPPTSLQGEEKISKDSKIKESGQSCLDLFSLSDGQNNRARKKKIHLSKEKCEQRNVPRKQLSAGLVQTKVTETGIKLVISKENLKEYKSSHKKHKRDRISDFDSKEPETGVKLRIQSENQKQNKLSKKEYKRDRKLYVGTSLQTSAQTGSMTSILESVSENLGHSLGNTNEGGNNIDVQSKPGHVDTKAETKHHRKHRQKKKRSKIISRYLDPESKIKIGEQNLSKLEDHDDEMNRKKLKEKRIQVNAVRKPYVPVVRLKRTCRKDNKEYHWEKYVEDPSDINDSGDCGDLYEEEEEEDDVGKKRGRINSFLGEQQTIYEILKHGSGDVMKNQKQDTRTRSVKEYDPREEELLTKVMEAGNRQKSSPEIPGPDAAEIGDTSEQEDQNGPLGDSTEPVFQNICDEDNVVLGGLAHYKAFILPFVYINGFKYISVQDAVVLFQKCAKQCTIPRSLLQKDKHIAKSFTCWEQVYQLELIKLKKGPNVRTGDILLRLDHLLTRLPALYKEIAAQHVITKLKKSQACKYNLRWKKPSHKPGLTPAKSKNTVKEKASKK